MVRSYDRIAWTPAASAPEARGIYAGRIGVSAVPETILPVEHLIQMTKKLAP